MSKDFVDQMLRGYKVAKNCMTKTNVIILGSPITRPPTLREAHLLRENVINGHQCSFYRRAIINGNRFHSKASTTLSRRINHAVLTENGAVVLVRSLVDVGLDIGYSFIDPVSTTKFTMIKDRDYCLWDSQGGLYFE